jgi:hypothetical protein
MRMLTRHYRALLVIALTVLLIVVSHAGFQGLSHL